MFYYYCVDSAKPAIEFEGSMLRIIRLLLVFLIMMSGLALHLRNDQAVTFDFYLGTIDLPFSVFLIAMLITGTILGVVACLSGLLRIKQENRSLRTRIRLAEKELDNLRVLPARN